MTLNIWDIAEEQTRKDIRAFEDIIKPKLEQYYKITGRDIEINLNEFGKYDKPVVFYTDNYILGYKRRGSVNPLFNDGKDIYDIDKQETYVIDEFYDLCKGF